jgi:hypothetical protein
MQESTKTIYSAFSGTFYTILEKDFSLLDMGQLPLVKIPPSSCKKCNGRGHLGRDNQTFHYYICNCVRKCLDVELIKKSIEQNLDFNNILNEDK